MNVIRDHIIEVSSSSLATRLQELKRNRAKTSHEYIQHKEHILVRLKRLLPGSTTGLNALEDPTSQDLVTEPREMARVLTEHSGRVLTGKPISKHLLSRWLQELPDKLVTSDNASWTLEREHVLESMRRSHETAPGPDGIPYSAYKKLGNYAVEYLFDAAEDLQEADQSPSPCFNHAILCCLPKTAARTDPVHGNVHTPEQTRPLSIVNTDNRLVANAYRLLLEPILKDWVSEMQRGFLPGRSMLSNIVDVDYDSML